MDPLVSTEWLAGEIGAPDLRVADATLLAADLGRDARAEFEAAHIPGAVFLDVAELRDTTSPLPNMRPSPAKLASRLSTLGLGDGRRIVLYDDSPWRTAARAWWLLASHGFTAAILDGGLAKWRAERRPVESGPVQPTEEHATPRPDGSRWRDLAATRAGDQPVVDARSASRFTGEEADPHGAAPGHIPGSANLPYPRLFEGNGTWKRGDALAAAFRDAGVDPERPFVATCGSGITAAVLAFGAHLLGTPAAIYDGSWSEWGADPSTPKAIGPA
jgi:thiosulfate/3-mercaptopyruvate sulfurtransferase